MHFMVARLPPHCHLLRSVMVGAGELGWLVFAGVSDVRGCGCALYAGRVEEAASFSEELVPGCDAGELWSPGLTG